MAYILWYVTSDNMRSVPPNANRSKTSSQSQRSVVVPTDLDAAVPLQGTVLSQAAAALLAITNKFSYPRMNLVQALTQSDKTILLTDFRQQPITNKTSVSWGLLWLGGNDVRDAFIEAVDVAISSQPIGEDESAALAILVRGLGHLGESDPMAVEYLVGHVKPEAWRSSARSESLPTDPYLDTSLAIAAIQGIGISGSDRLDPVVEDLSGLDLEVFKEIDGALVEAYFHKSMRSTISQKEYLLMCLSGLEGSHFSEWRTFGEGKKRFEAFKQLHKLP